jgi:hypothetical protein
MTTMTVQGSTAPILSNSTAERGFAKGVGLEKSTDTSNAGVKENDLTADTIP